MHMSDARKEVLFSIIRYFSRDARNPFLRNSTFNVLRKICTTADKLQTEISEFLDWTKLRRCGLSHLLFACDSLFQIRVELGRFSTLCEVHYWRANFLLALCVFLVYTATIFQFIFFRRLKFHKQQFCSKKTNNKRKILHKDDLQIKSTYYWDNCRQL